MIHIPTTATAVQKLKRLAKTRRKSSGESLASALDATAREGGYRDWKHVTVCLDATAGGKAAPICLPETISAFLAEQQSLNPPEPETVQAMASGLVFAMDIKDADNERPEDNPEFEECEDARAFLAGGIWLGVLRREQEEGVGESRDMEEGEEVQEFIDFLGNYRFFRYLGPVKFATLDEAFAGVLKEFFFPPTHVWLAAKLFDMADVSQVRVDGRTVYATGPAKSGTTTPAAQPPSAAVAKSNPRSRPDIVARLDVRKLQPGLYEFHVSHSGQELFSDAGFSSIADALRAAADVEGAIRGYQVAYAGLVEGTYLVEDLAETADAVAERSVELVKSLGDYD